MISLSEALNAYIKTASTSATAQALSSMPKSQTELLAPSASSTPSVQTQATPSSVSSVLASLDLSQQRALSNIISSPVSILTGAAGTGKTFTVCHIIGELLKEYPTESIFLTAFTGKAVLNIIKSISASPLTASVSGNAMTIHRFLEFHPEYFNLPQPDGSITKTRRFVPTYTSTNQRNDCKVLIVDEVSMVSQDLMLQLLTALSLQSLDKLILIGDINQLQPVIGSSSLATFAAHPSTSINCLSTIHRQANGNDIVEAAHLIKTANLAKLKERIANGGFRNCKFIRVENYVDLYLVTEAICRERYLNFTETIETVEPTKPCCSNPASPKRRDAIITATNIGPTGQEILNQRLNKILKVEKHCVQCGVAVKLLGIGDNVMFTKNDYERGFINGTVGRIINIRLNDDIELLNRTTQNVNSNFSAPSTDFLDIDTIASSSAKEALSKSAKDNGADGAKGADDETNFYNRSATHELTVEFTDIYGAYRQITLSSIGDISNLLLANAMTCYKAQGSTYSRVIVNLVDWQGGASINNEYAYTALTRAADFAWIIYNDSGLAKIKNRQLAGESDAEKLATLATQTAKPVTILNAFGQEEQYSVPDVINSFIKNLTNK